MEPAYLPAPPVSGAERSEVRIAVYRFLLMGLVALVIVAIPVGFWIREVSEDYALENAKGITQRLADYAVGPLVSDELLAGNPESIRRLDNRLSPWIANGAVSRIKVLNADGQVIYSNVPTLIGRELELRESSTALLAEGQGSVTYQSRDELIHELDGGTEELVEVLVGSRGADGDPLIVQAYYDDENVRAQHGDLLLGIVPAILLALVVLQLAQLVPAVRLARRVQGHQVVRRLLLQRAMDASEMERRRIARELHDEVIQDLSGLAYAMESQETHGDPGQQQFLNQSRTMLQENVRTLRSMTSALYLTDVQDLDLCSSLERLTEPLKDQGVDVRSQLAECSDLSSEQSAVLYRLAREILMNISKHAHARTVDLVLTREARRTVMVVHDDGIGFDAKAQPREGHLGLMIMKDAISEAGGSIEVRSRLGEGTRVVVILGAPRADAAR
ncbi:sensor histidine kinase [Arthrobacter sp. AET 35A]|nr:sensor histidine kinase [Arthrobacter sp. AET 35A]